MTKVIVESGFWELFPNATICVLHAESIDQALSEQKQAQLAQALIQAEHEAKRYLTTEVFSENNIIQEWRTGFSKFKTKKGARSSIEALLKRIDQGKTIQPILPLVDCYNTVSLRYAVPVGGEDLSAVDGDIHLGKAVGGESFYPLGAEKDSPALSEELIYFDQAGAICRSLNWREAQRTMLTETTTDAVFFIEAITSDQRDRVLQAAQALKELLEDIFSVSVSLDILTQAQPTIVID